MYLDGSVLTPYLKIYFSQGKMWEKGKGWDFKYEICSFHIQKLKLPLAYLFKEGDTFSHFQQLRLVPVLQKAIFSDALLLSAVGDCCHEKENNS